MAYEGQKGCGTEGYSKYEAANKPIVKNGGNAEKTNGIRTSQSPESMYKSGSYGKDGAAAN